jgi:Domain of unknown function (DUF4276)
VTPPVIASIVEGHGEVQAVPILLHRLARVLAPALTVITPLPIRISRSRLGPQFQEFERALELAARYARAGGGVLVLLDADDDCPAELGPDLLRRVRTAHSDLPIALALAKFEFESWFIAAAASLRGHADLADDLPIHPDPESIRGAKEWLSQRKMGRHAYVETLDQPTLTRQMDLQSARQASSFDKFYREVEKLLRTLERTRSRPGSSPG